MGQSMANLVKRKLVICPEFYRFPDSSAVLRVDLFTETMVSLKDGLIWKMGSLSQGFCLCSGIHIIAQISI